VARQRDSAAEYARERQLAHERGFSSVREMRDAFRERREILADAGEEPTGRNRHDLVSYFIDYEGMTEDEAIAAMRAIWGHSPGGEE
jgi:hypothetical protein